MKKNRKKRRTEEKKVAIIKGVQKLAKKLLSSEDQKAIAVGESLRALAEDLNHLSPEVFANLGAKVEKAFNESAPQQSNEMMMRLEQLVRNLETSQTPTVAGLSGVHNTQQLTQLSDEITTLKGNAHDLQQLQNEMKQSIAQFAEWSESIQATLVNQATVIESNVNETKKTTSTLQTAFTTEIGKMSATFANNITEANQAVTAIATALKTNEVTASELEQKQLKQLQDMQVAFESKLAEASTNSTRYLNDVKEQVNSVVSELSIVKKNTSTPISALQGSVRGINEQLEQLKNVMAYLEQKAKESMQLIKADEDEEYVQEATELVTVLVERLSVGAKLYATHRETIEAIEQGEREKEAWELEKENYTGAYQKVEILEAALKARDEALKSKDEEIKKQNVITQNKAKRTPVEMLKKLAEASAIEEWPEAMQQVLANEKIQVVPAYAKGTVHTVSGDQLAELGKYITLASSNNSQIELTTSCYMHQELGIIVQRAASKLID